jgi:hypothetical protein
MHLVVGGEPKKHYTGEEEYETKNGLHECDI